LYNPVFIPFIYKSVFHFFLTLNSGNSIACSAASYSTRNECRAHWKDGMTVQKNNWFLLAFLLLIVIFIIGCGGGSDSGSSGSAAISSQPDNSASVNTRIDLPDTSPVSREDIQIEVFDDAFGNGEDTIEIKTAKETVTDAYIMLPQREGDSGPTVYLFASVLPGEDNVVLSAESTAVGLVMNGIAHYHLIHAGSPSEVKAAIRLNAQAFIDNFEQMLDDDPYVLHLDNLMNVYDAVYTDAVSDCTDALETMLAAKGMSGLSFGIQEDKPGERAAGLLIVDPDEEIDGFRVLAEVEDNLKMTGDMFIENDTRLLAHYKVTDALTKDVLKDLPDTFFSTAFNKDILRAQEGVWGFFIASDNWISTNFTDVIIDVYTPGRVGINYSEYSSGPGPALLARSFYSSYLLPALGAVLPITDLGKAVFGVMADAKVFDDALPHWYAGDYNKGFELFHKNLTEPTIPNPVVSKIIEKVFEKILYPKFILTTASKLGLKLAASEVMIGITKLELELYEYDLNNTPAHLTFNVAFPVTLKDMKPKAIAKDQDEETIVSLHGTGLKKFTFQSSECSPLVFLTAKDKNDDYFDSRTLKDDQITTNAEGTVIDFILPTTWMEKDSAVDVVEVRIGQNYIVPGVLWDSLSYIELPATEPEQADFTIDLTSGLVITNLSKNSVQGSDELIIDGVDLNEDTDLYDVYFLTRYDAKVPATIVNGTTSMLRVTVPDYTELVVGETSVYVEAADGTESNKLSLAVIPEDVYADPNSTGFETSLDITLTQPQGLSYIIYSLNTGDEDVYTSPIHIDQTTKIYARARQTVDGVDYDSKKEVFEYIKCAADEILDEGVCVKPCNRVCNAPVIASSITLPSFESEYDIILMFDKVFKMCAEEVADIESLNGKTTMLYFYRTDGSGTYTQPDPVSFPGYEDYEFGEAFVTAGSSFSISMSPLPDYNSSTVKYFDPETNFGMDVQNFNSLSESNEFDFLWINVTLPSGTHRTIINTEVVAADGCYEGNYSFPPDP